MDLMAQQATKAKGRKIVNIVIWAIGILIILGGSAVAGLHLYVSNSKPLIEGEKIVSILDEDVEVTRDGVGVPHILAKSDAALYRA